LRLRFKFWIITIAALLAVVLTLALGRWQLSRADQKEAYQAATESQGRLPAVDAQTLMATVDLMTLVHRTIYLRGRWLSQHTVYLDNRQMNDKVGQFVLTPFQIEGSGTVLLVQRGWLARNFLDRALFYDEEQRQRKNPGAKNGLCPGDAGRHFNSAICQHSACLEAGLYPSNGHSVWTIKIYRG